MNSRIKKFKSSIGQVNEQHVKLGLALITLALFLLGAGAPASGSGGG